MKKLCSYCTKEYEWDGIKRYPKGQAIGFRFEYFCSKECSVANKMDKQKATKLERYGSESFVNIKKRKKTKLEKYGIIGYNNQEKRKETMLYKHGFIGVNVERLRENNLEKYGVKDTWQREDVKEKIKQIHEERFGGMGFAVNSIKKKSQETRKVKYNNENYTNIEQAKQTHIEKYSGMGLGSQKIKAKHIKGLQEKYGVDWITQTEQFKELFNNKEWLNSRQQKQHETKKKNDSYQKSKKEDIIYLLLKEKYPNTIRQHKTVQYPFACDFYVPELNLYIEYQGYWTHGHEIFDSNNIKHQEKIKKWEQKYSEIGIKGKKKELYLRAIKAWTIVDPLKRKTAKENGLNWIEFFNIKQFEEWL